jgi:thiol:disulfide interchange protein
MKGTTNEMKTRIVARIGLSVAAAALLLAGFAPLGRAGGPTTATGISKYGPIAWTSSLELAQKKAAREKKVVLVDFTAEWCGPCKQMLATTYKDKAVVARAAKQFVPVLIDVDKQPKLAQKYNVSAIPTVLFLDGSGKVLHRSMGYHDTKAFLKIMDQAAGKKTVAQK